MHGRLSRRQILELLLQVLVEGRRRRLGSFAASHHLVLRPTTAASTATTAAAPTSAPFLGVVVTGAGSFGRAVGRARKSGLLDELISVGLGGRGARQALAGKCHKV